MTPRSTIIAVTGEVGKTTVADMLRQALGPSASVEIASIESLKNPEIPALSARYLVLPVSPDELGGFATIPAELRPDLLLITTLGNSTAEGRKQYRGYRDLLACLKPSSGVVLNRDEGASRHIANLARQHGHNPVWIGSQGYPRFKLTNWWMRSDATSFTFRHKRDEFCGKIGAPGRHQVMNALSVLAAIDALGQDFGLAAISLANWEPPEGQGRHYIISRGPGGIDGEFRFIDESLSVNPASVSASLSALAAMPVRHHTGRVAHGRRIAVLGEMDEAVDPRALVAHPDRKDIDRFYFFGDEMTRFHNLLHTSQPCRWFAGCADLPAILRRSLDEGDIVMVKGSKRGGLRPIVDAIFNLGDCRSAALGQGEF